MFKIELTHFYQKLQKSPSLPNVNSPPVLKDSFITKGKFWNYCIWENKAANFLYPLVKVKATGIMKFTEYHFVSSVCLLGFGL